MLSLIDKIMKISGQFQAENMWSVSSGMPPENHPLKGGHFAAESGGQFERILHAIFELQTFRVLINHHSLE